MNESERRELAQEIAQSLPKANGGEFRQRVYWGMVGATCAFVFIGSQLGLYIWRDVVRGEGRDNVMMQKIVELEKSMDFTRTEVVGLLKSKHEHPEERRGPSGQQ